MDDISEQVEALLADRRTRLPAVRAEIDKWHRVDAAVVALAEAVADLRHHPATPPSASAQLGQLRIADARPGVATAIGPLQRVERRIGRDRLCIGVGGASGSGKTTLVQSLCGLTDAVLPTDGSGPVTAVPTRVAHSPGQLRVVLEPHTVDTFHATHNEIQEARSSYEGLLDRHGRPLELVGDELDRLREYVAYPSGAYRAHDQPIPHRYLGVREARLECAFPHADVGAIEFVDLPAAGHRRPHLVQLRHDVDVAFLVTRVADGSGRWDADDDALALLDEIRGGVSRRSDFVSVVVNTGGDAPTDEVEPGNHLRAMIVDVRDPDAAVTHVLRPVLRHLAARLPAMDAEVHADARARTRITRDGLIDLAVAAKVLVSQACPAVAGTTGDLYSRTDDLITALAVALRAVPARAREHAGREDAEFTAATRRIHGEIIGWIRDGLGVGYAPWCAAARRGMLRGGTAEAFVQTELDRIRAEIDQRYQGLDVLLRRRLEVMRNDVAGAMGPLLGDRSGAAFRARRPGRQPTNTGAALEYLDELAAASSRPCPVLRAAVANLLAVRLDYRTHLGPRVRAASEPLAADGPPGGEEVDELYRTITEWAERTAARVLSRLMTEAELPGWILLTAVERFVDTIVGPEVAEREFRNLARSYRHSLWPGHFSGLDGDDATVNRVVRACDHLLAVTADLDPTDSALSGTPTG